MRTSDELRSLNERFHGEPTEVILGWAWERFGGRAALGTGFQGAGLVMLLAKVHNPPFPVFTLDTGLLFQETVDLMKALEWWSCMSSTRRAGATL